MSFAVQLRLGNYIETRCQHFRCKLFVSNNASLIRKFSGPM